MAFKNYFNLAIISKNSIIAQSILLLLKIDSIDEIEKNFVYLTLFTNKCIILIRVK